jgi:hypothetical protein
MKLKRKCNGEGVILLRDSVALMQSAYFLQSSWISRNGKGCTIGMMFGCLMNYFRESNNKFIFYSLMVILISILFLMTLMHICKSSLCLPSEKLY